MAIQQFSPADGKDPESFYRKMLGPSAVDNQIRTAINTCWRLMPEGKRNAADVSVEIRRLVDRALADFAEDAAAQHTRATDAPPSA